MKTATSKAKRFATTVDPDGNFKGYDGRTLLFGWYESALRHPAGRHAGRWPSMRRRPPARSTPRAPSEAWLADQQGAPAAGPTVPQLRQIEEGAGDLCNVGILNFSPRR